MKEQIMEIARILLDVGKSYYGMECDQVAAMCEAHAVYEAGYRKSEWISVEDRMPESGATVLGYSEIIGDMRCYEICKGRCDNTLQWWSETGWATVQDLLVTHWMPLPEPPKMKGGAE